MTHQFFPPDGRFGPPRHMAQPDDGLQMLQVPGDLGLLGLASRDRVHLNIQKAIENGHL